MVSHHIASKGMRCPHATAAAHASASADDIVRARVRTLGVEEHHFTMENGPSLLLFICTGLCSQPSDGAVPPTRVRTHARTHAHYIQARSQARSGTSMMSAGRAALCVLLPRLCMRTREADHQHMCSSP